MTRIESALDPADEGPAPASARRLAHRASISLTGERLTKLMKDRDLSARSLAAAVRIQVVTLQNFRDGHRRLPDDVLQSIARHLGTNADFLMDRSDDPRAIGQDG